MIQTPAIRSPSPIGAGRAMGLLLVILTGFWAGQPQAKPAGPPAHPILEAKKAFEDRDPAALTRARAKLAGDPLYVWADYWTTRVLVAKDPFSAQAPGLVQDFARQHGTHPLVRTLQRDWGVAALDKGPWLKAIEVILEIPTDLDSPGIRCARGRLAGTLTPTAALALLEGNEASPGCLLLMEDLTDQGLISPEALRTRARWAAVAGEAQVADRIHAMAGLPKQSKAVLAERDLLKVLAEARVQSSRALSRFEQIKGHLSSEQRAFGAMVLGTRLWARSHERAWPLTKEGFRSRHVQPDVVLETAARQALRFDDREALGELITAMPPRLQEDETWLYWRGWLHQTAGRPFEAKLTWSKIPPGFGFYAQLVVEPLNRVFLPPRLTDEQLSEIRQFRRALQQSPAVQRTLTLSRLGLRTEATVEWNGLLQGQPDLLLLAANEVALEAALPDRAISAAIRTKQIHSMAHRYPSPYVESVLKLTTPGSVKTAWVMGLVRQESRFIHDIRSPVGAIGLMQLMPRTAKEVAAQLGIRRLQVKRLEDPEFNLSLGIQYLRELSSEFNGSTVLATAAYNAGPSRSRTWQATLQQPISGAAFAESIPFAETRDYVKKVLSNAAAYQASLEILPRRVGLDQDQGRLADWLDPIGPRQSTPGLASN